MSLLRLRGPGGALLLHGGGGTDPGRRLPGVQPLCQDPRLAGGEHGRSPRGGRPGDAAPGPAGGEGRIRARAMTDDTEPGGGEPRKAILRFNGRRLCPVGHSPVEEYPVALTVNGRELATLIASPHDLKSLVVGFLRMQGLVDRLDDIQALTVCSDFGAASVRIRKEVPSRLVPTLTSGCGGGIGFNLPGAPGRSARAGGGAAPGQEYSPDDVFRTMDQLARLAERYRAGGGIHSAAAGDGRKIFVYAEDIGRHNTIDRIAGEALLS